MALDLSQQIAQTDVHGFTQLLEEIVAGETALGYGYFRFPPNEDLTGAVPVWALIDNRGVVYSSGNCQEFSVETDSYGVSVRVSALVGSPSTLPPSSRGVSYQLRWSLNFPAKPSTHFSQGIKVTGLVETPSGPSATVELEGDFLTVNLIIPQDLTVTAGVYDSNNNLLFSPQVDSSTEVAGGYLFSTKIDPSNVSPSGNPLLASLDPYVLSWKAVDSQSLYTVNRSVSEIFIVNTSILSAVEDARRMVMKANTTLFGFEDTLFDVVTILSWLRRGRDLFNSAAGMFTEFTMKNATGGIREYWLRYSEVAMLMAQSLAEGEKAFNYSGQAISLEVDKASVYQAAADSLQQKLDNDIKPMKQNLLKKGAIGGDGNMAGLAQGARGASMLGISIHPASQFGRYGYPWGYNR